MTMLQHVKAKSFEKKDLLTADEFRTIVDRVLQKQSVLRLNGDTIARRLTALDDHGFDLATSFAKDGRCLVLR